MKNRLIASTEKDYPERLSALLGPDAPSAVTLSGYEQVLVKPTLALFCSKQCPGAMILQTYDFVSRLRRHDVTLLSGFHSPMEKECLRTFSGGTASAVWCIAKALALFRMPREFENMYDDNRLLVMSVFPEHVNRISAGTAAYRNLTAAVLADEVFIPYAAPRSSTETFCRRLLALNKLVLTLDAPENERILDQGAQPITARDINSLWATILTYPREDDLI